jgi:two-component system chemotaxis response regulator CheY
MKKLLVGIDDSNINLLLFEETARIMDLDIITASNGQEGLDRVNKTIAEGRKPDIIIVDIHMPVMDGLQFLKHIKEDPKTKYIPVLVLTTEVALEPKTLAKDYGAAGWLIKPFSPDELKQVLIKFI